MTARKSSRTTRIHNPGKWKTKFEKGFSVPLVIPPKGKSITLDGYKLQDGPVFKQRSRP